MNKAVYAGTFDPITSGHADIVERASILFDHVVIAVGAAPGKETMFSLEERIEMAQAVADCSENVSVGELDGLVVDFARREGAEVLIRGLRGASDFDYENQMAQTNRKLASDIETIFLVPGETKSSISSTFVREIARLGGDIGDFVPSCVLGLIQRNLKGRK